MARLSFTQGIVRHGATPRQIFFLQQNGQYVDLVVSPDLTTIAFADGYKNYLFTESVTVLRAWGPFTVPSQEQWLYWDINRVSGVRTFGSTIYAPVYSDTPPASPSVGQMWFDTGSGNPETEMMMHEWSGTRWVHVLRVFAAKYVNNIFYSPIDGVSVETNFKGTQIGAAGLGNYNIGSLVFDKSKNPIVNQDGKFFTTEDVFTTGVPTGASLKVNNILIRAQAETSVAKYQVVVFNKYNKIVPTGTFDFIDKVYGIVEEDIPTNDIGNVILEGIIFNEDWDFTDPVNNPNMSGDVNDPVYVNAYGELTTNKATTIPGQVPVGAIVGPQSILFSPGIYGTSIVPAETDHGTLTGLLDDDHPQYFNEARGDARYYTQAVADSIFAPTTHTHSRSDITDFAHLHVEADIQDLDKYTQAEANNLFVNVSGDTMTGPLVLYGDPASDLEAATKQYVDAVAAGLDSKDSVAVATTGDIGGTYNPSGGSAGTGQFTGVDIQSLDGSYLTDYDFTVTNRVLVKNQIDARQNGIYVVTDYSNPANATLERAPDHDGNPSSEVSPGNYTFVANGLTQAGTGWVILAGTATGPSDTIRLNVDEINWALVSSVTAYNGDGTTISIDVSNVISVIPASSGGQVDALLWNGQANNITSISDRQLFLYDLSTNTWINSFLNTLRNSSNASNIIIDETTNDIGISSGGVISTSANSLSFVSSVNNIDFSSASFININATLDISLTAGSTNLLVNAATSTIDLNSALNISPSSTEGTINLSSGSFNTTIKSAVLSNDVNFTLPPNNGTFGYILSTDGAGNTSWIAPPSGGGGGGSQFCLSDTDGDTYVEVGFGSSPSCTDSGSNEVRIQAGNAQTSPLKGGKISILSGIGNSDISGDIDIIAAGDVPPAIGGGNINITAGSASAYTSNVGGSINITSGDGGGQTTNTAGDINLVAGKVPDYFGPLPPGSTPPNTGSIFIKTQGAYNSQPGDIHLMPGLSSTDSGSNVGNIRIKLNSTFNYTTGFKFESNSGYFVGLKSTMSFGTSFSLILPSDNYTYPAASFTTPAEYGNELYISGTGIGTDNEPTYTVGFRRPQFNIKGEAIGAVADGQLITQYALVNDIYLTSGANGWSAYAAIAPTADATFEVSYIRGGTSTTIYTITFAAGSNTPNTMFSSAIDLLQNDIIVIRCVTANGIGDVTFTLKAHIRGL